MPESQRKAVEALRLKSVGFITARSIYAVAKLGIADLLGDGARTADDLAAATGADPRTLYRMLRALAGEGVFHEDSRARFSLTPIGRSLRTDVPDSLAAYIVMCHEYQFPAWLEVLHSVETGEVAFVKAFGKTWIEHLVEHDAKGENIFQAAMTSAERIQNPALAETYDFSSARVVADIGGGNGSLLSTLLTRHDHLSGILFDLEHAIEAARAGAGGPLPRCETVAGDFFESVPPGADHYVLKRVLHDWDDERAIAILRNCRKAMADGGKVLIIETMIGAANQSTWGKLQDLSMLIGAGGMERTEEEFAVALEHAELRLDDVLQTPSDLNILVATAS